MSLSPEDRNAALAFQFRDPASQDDWFCSDEGRRYMLDRLLTHVQDTRVHTLGRALELTLTDYRLWWLDRREARLRETEAS